MTYLRAVMFLVGMLIFCNSASFSAAQDFPLPKFGPTLKNEGNNLEQRLAVMEELSCGDGLRFPGIGNLFGSPSSPSSVLNYNVTESVQHYNNGNIISKTFEIPPAIDFADREATFEDNFKNTKGNEFSRYTSDVYLAEQINCYVYGLLTRIHHGEADQSEVYKALLVRLEKLEATNVELLAEKNLELLARVEILESEVSALKSIVEQTREAVKDK
ncbi:hypothetical protein LZK77_16180 [Rhizobium leguminosarum]|nr:hypothetical protein LZK77_16180 [Rhizobium leguminosarum]